MHFIYGYHTMWPIICAVIVWLILIVIGVFLVRNFINGAPKSMSSSKKKSEKGQIDIENRHRGIKH